MPALGQGSGKSAAGEKRAKRKIKPAPKVKVRPPTKAQVRNSQAQQNQYVSQGKAVKKVARQQTKVRVAHERATAPTIRRAGEDKSDANRAKAENYVRQQYVKQLGPKDAAKAYRQGTTVLPHELFLKNVRREQGREQLQREAVSAPVLKALDQTTRTLHASAAGARAVIKGKSVGAVAKAELRGLQNKDKSTYSDVAGDLGVKNKAVKGALGFAGDIAFDPSTYVTGGAGSIARKAAEAEAKRVAAKSLTKGLTKDQAERMGARAAAKTLKTADQTKGVVVRYGGREIPGVRKATAKASKPVRAVARKVAPERARNTARSVAADVNPDAAPVGVSKETSRKAVQATRTARGRTNQGTRRAVNVGQGIRQQIGEENYNTVVDAIEAGKIGKLPPELRQHAVALRSESRHVRRVQRQAGVAVADVTKSPHIKGYVPRKLTKEADEAAGHSGKAAVLRPGSSKARVEKRRMSVVRDEKPGVYREDLHAVMAERVAEGHGAAAKATLAQDLARLGRPVRRGKPNPIDKETEALFHAAPGKALREVTDSKEVDRALKPLTLNKKGSKVKGATPKERAGRYVVLNKELVKRSVESANPTLQGPGIVHALDKATSGFKRVAIFTPGFHVRNFAGDVQNAYLGQPAHHLPGNMRRAAKVLKAHGAGEKALRQLKPAEVGKATLRTEKYGAVTYDQVAKELAQRGAFRSGFIAGELRELSKSGGQSATRIAATVRKGREIAGQIKPARSVKQFGLNREDLPRLTTAMEALRHGATWEEAASSVAGLHFDYQHLTNFERQIARRAMPFYTWSARNIPLQARKFVTKPGKYAHYQALREEAIKASGADQVDPQTRDLYKQLEQAGVKMPGGFERYLSEWEQRNASIPISWKGHKFTVSSGLPIADLNELPGAALSRQLDEYYQKGMSLTGPFPKDLVEYFDNHSFFFRDQLERDTSPLVAAPGWAQHLPGPVKKAAGLTPDYIDKKTGKKTWGWKGKADYIFSAVPGTPNYLKQLSTGGTDRRGKNTAGKLLSWAGIKSVPMDPVKNAVNLAYARMQEIQTRLAAIRQTGVGKANPTPEWRKLNDQLKVVTNIAYQGKAAQGYKVLPTAGAPPKGRVRKSASTKPSGGGFFGGKSSSRSSGGGFFSGSASSSGSGSSSGGGFFK